MFENLKRTLKNAEVPPPTGAWNHIASSLAEDEHAESLKSRLYDFTVAAPATSWFAISSRLHNQSFFPAKSLTGHFTQKKAVRILAAAAVTGLLVMGGFYFFNRSGVRKQEVSYLPHGKKGSEQSVVPPLQNPASEEPDVMEHEVLNIAAGLPVSNKVKKNETHEATRLLRNSIVRLSGFPNRISEIVVAARPIRNEKGDIIQDAKVLSNPNARYIKVTSPNGEQTHISSKFKNLLLYLNLDNDVGETDGYFDKTFIESLVWKSRFKTWRDKILENSIIPSSTNFMDIVELKDLILKDKEGK